MLFAARLLVAASLLQPPHLRQRVAPPPAETQSDRRATSCPFGASCPGPDIRMSTQRYISCQIHTRVSIKSGSGAIVRPVRIRDTEPRDAKAVHVVSIENTIWKRAKSSRTPFGSSPSSRVDPVPGGVASRRVRREILRVGGLGREGSPCFENRHDPGENPRCKTKYEYTTTGALKS